MSQSVPVTVEILGKEYRIACAAHEKEALLASARYLDEKMIDVRNTGKVVGSERIAKFGDHDKDKLIRQRLQGLQERIDAALDESPQLPI